MLIIKVHNVVINPNQFQRNYHIIMKGQVRGTEYFSFLVVRIWAWGDTLFCLYLINFYANCKLCCFILDSIVMTIFQWNMQIFKWSFGNNDGFFHTSYGPVVTFVILSWIISASHGIFKPCNKIWHFLDITEV